VQDYHSQGKHIRLVLIVEHLPCVPHYSLSIFLSQNWTQKGDFHSHICEYRAFCFVIAEKEERPRLQVDVGGRKIEMGKLQGLGERES
jgi:hypothetical protein